MRIRSISDRALRRWLATGKPKRVERALGRSSAVAARLDALSELNEQQLAALEGLVTPTQDFENRVLAGVQRRRDLYGAASLLADLLGLGVHTARALVERSSLGVEEDGGDD
jgi:hypothetical protein